MWFGKSLMRAKVATMRFGSLFDASTFDMAACSRVYGFRKITG